MRSLPCPSEWKKLRKHFRTALAMGADRAILVVATDDVQTDIEPLTVAKILKAVVDEEHPGTLSFVESRQLITI